MRKYRNTKSIAGQSALVGVDDGKDWTWNAALAQGSADLIQGLGPQRGAWTLYKAELYNNIQYSGEPSARRPWVGRTDGEQEENWERNWESDKKRLTRVKAPLLPSTILYFSHPAFLPSCYIMPSIQISYRD